MFNFNELKEDLDFDNIKNEDNAFVQELFNKLFEKVVNFQEITEQEKKLFWQNIDSGCVYKYKVKDKDELKRIIGARLNPIVRALPPSTEYSIDGTYEVSRIEMNLNWLDVSNITDMSNVFVYNENWYGQFIIVSDWDVSHVTNMSGMFLKISNFNSDISKWDVSNVTNMQEMFSGCQDFNQDISDWNVHNVTNMQEMFNFCVNFNQDLSRWDVSNVNNMIEMFNMCIEFECDLKNWNIESLEKCDSIFNNCVKLKDKKPWWYFEFEFNKQIYGK